MTGGGPSEAASSSGPTAEQQDAIKRRVLLGGGATAALLAFAFVPTKDLRLKPSKPMYFYLTALLRVEVGVTCLCLHAPQGALPCGRVIPASCCNFTSQLCCVLS